MYACTPAQVFNAINISLYSYLYRCNIYLIEMIQYTQTNKNKKNIFEHENV